VRFPNHRQKAARRQIICIRKVGWGEEKKGRGGGGGGGVLQILSLV